MAGGWPLESPSGERPPYGSCRERPSVLLVMGLGARPTATLCAARAEGARRVVQQDSSAENLCPRELI